MTSPVLGLQALASAVPGFYECILGAKAGPLMLAGPALYSLSYLPGPMTYERFTIRLSKSDAFMCCVETDMLNL